MKFFIAFFLLHFTFLVNAQTAHNENLIYNSGGGISITEIKAKPKKATGSYYYNEKWQNGSMKLFSGEEIKDYPLKFDMRMKQIDILVNNEIKTISIGEVKEIIWQTNQGGIEILKNSSLYKNSNKSGFYTILSDGKISFLKRTDLVLLDSNYNTAMDVGNDSKKYIKKEKYFVLIEDKLLQIKKSKRRVLSKLNDKDGKIKDYAEENKLNFKSDYDLSQIFNYYNSL